MISEFSREEVAMATKFMQKRQICTDFGSVQDIETFFSRITVFSDIVNSNMLSKFSEIKGSCHGNQIWAKINRNCSTITLLMIKNSNNQCKKTFQFITQCKGDISHAFKTAKNHCV